MKNKLTVTIGIPALNEEANIGLLLEDLLNQDQQKYTLEQIIIASDGSTDRTVDVVKGFRNVRIKIIEGRRRCGKATRQNQIFNKAKSDVIIILDADVTIKSSKFISKMIAPIASNDADLVAAAIYELKPITFFEHSLYVSMAIKRMIFEKYNNGNNVYTCVGRARAFSKELYKRLKFSESVGEDAYSYLFCIFHGFRYKYLKDMVVYYKLPETLGDHLKQSSRFVDSISMMSEEFGEDFIKKQYSLPPIFTMLTFGKYFSKFPLQVFIYITVYYFIVPCYLKVRGFKKSSINNQWHMATSSKTLCRTI